MFLFVFPNIQASEELLCNLFYTALAREFVGLEGTGCGGAVRWLSVVIDCWSLLCYKSLLEKYLPGMRVWIFAGAMRERMAIKAMSNPQFMDDFQSFVDALLEGQVVLSIGEGSVPLPDIGRTALSWT